MILAVAGLRPPVANGRRLVAGIIGVDLPPVERLLDRRIPDWSFTIHRLVPVPTAQRRIDVGSGPHRPIARRWA